MNYTAEEISSIIHGKAHINLQHEIVNHICIDSRTNMYPNMIFFAIKGERHDGHVFIEELIQKGVKNFVVEFDLNRKDVNFLVVKNSVVALQELASYHRKRLNGPLIAITGSNGKTVVKEWLFQMLWKDQYICRNPKSYNSQIGVPLSVMNINDNHTLGIFEAGISKPNEMINLQKILTPDIGIFTNIGSAHDEGFLNTEEKVLEKLNLFKNSKTIIYNQDYIEIHQQILHKNLPSFAWSRKNRNAPVYISDIQYLSRQTQVSINYNKAKYTLQIPFQDDASIENALHGIVLLMYLGYSTIEIQEKLNVLYPVAMRLELKEGKADCLIINDTYNSDVQSLKIALDFMSRFEKEYKHKILILSDILEVSDEALTYQHILEMVRLYSLNKIYGIGEKLSHYFMNEPNIVCFKNTEDFLRFIENKPINQSLVLIKGARFFEFERITKYFERKVHETTLEVNLKALEHNFNYYKSLLLPQQKIMTMLKAFSYGSGSYEIAKVLEYNKVDYIGVAYLDEGIQLRSQGIKTPIMVMNPETYFYERMLQYNLEPVVYSIRIMHEIAYFLLKNPHQIIGIHLEFDTGMHRLGFEPDEVQEVVRLLREQKNIHVLSVFSHLSSSDNAQDDAFTNNQITKFTQIITFLKEHISYPFLTHISNSSAIERFSNLHFDMVRLGIGLYGFSAYHKHFENLIPVSTLKTSISQLKKIKKGESVGYTQKNKVLRNSTIATIPIGYADGIHRSFGNGNATFILHHQEVPTIGNICMDMCMLDVTDVLNVQEGDEVEVFGLKKSILQLSTQVKTIPYEILTSISSRVKRIYFNE